MPDHPMRKLTRQVAFDGAWDAERAKKVGDLFDGMAADWSTDHVDATTCCFSPARSIAYLPPAAP